MPYNSKYQTLFRQWEMLRLLPRPPSPPVAAQQLVEKLEGSGFAVDERTVQRDLQTLKDFLPIELIGGTRPYRWRWEKAASLNIPGVTLPEALALRLVEQHLTPLLPTSMLDVLGGLFRDAEKKLNCVADINPAKSWLSKVRVVSPTQPLLPPKVDVRIQHIVYDALLRGLQVGVVYQGRQKEMPSRMPLHVLGLLQRGPVTYLVATAKDHTDIRLFALHRIQEATLLEAPVHIPEGFDLDAWLETGAMGFTRTDKPLLLYARFSADAVFHLRETPLSQDQTIVLEADGRYLVTATVNDTQQLRWWLLGFADGCEVLEPRELREQIAAALRSASDQYPVNIART